MKNNNKNRKILVCFEIDNVLLRGFEYSWKEVWQHLGYDDDIRRAAMRLYLCNEISYAEWCGYCLDHFKQAGLRREDFATITTSLQVVRNLREGLMALREAGAVLAVVSGGIDTFLEAMLPECESLFDHIFINRFRYDATGRLIDIVPTPFDFEGKADCIVALQKCYAIPTSRTWLIGGNINDYTVAKTAGTSIAWRPDSAEVKNTFDEVITGDDFMVIANPILSFLQ